MEARSSTLDDRVFLFISPWSLISPSCLAGVVRVVFPTLGGPRGASTCNTFELFSLGNVALPIINLICFSPQVVITELYDLVYWNVYPFRSSNRSCNLSQRDDRTLSLCRKIPGGNGAREKHPRTANKSLLKRAALILNLVSMPNWSNKLDRTAGARIAWLFDVLSLAINTFLFSFFILW